MTTAITEDLQTRLLEEKLNIALSVAALCKIVIAENARLRDENAHLRIANRQLEQRLSISRERVAPNLPSAGDGVLTAAERGR